MRTYGVLAYKLGKWIFKAEYHVFMKFDRFFMGAEKMPQKSTAFLLHSGETAKDLLWFMSRYPLVISDRDRAFLEKDAAAYEVQCGKIDAVLRGNYKPEVVSLAIPPREYQMLPAELAVAGGGCISGDDVGLGKTVEGICLLSRMECRPALVVTMTHLTHQWQAEIKRFAPNLKTHIITTTMPATGLKQDALAKLVDRGVRMPDVLITTYTRLYGWREWLAPKVKSVIFDEVHELRNGITTNKGQGAAAIVGQVRYRLGLTATPVYNYGGEIFNVIEMVAPGVLGSREEFGRTWGGFSTESRIDNPAALGQYLRERGVFIRRTKADVGRELPEVTITPQICDADEKEIAANIGENAEEMARMVLSGGDGTRGDAMRAGGDLDWQLRQATGIAKAPYVAEFIRLIAESGEKVVVFAWHRTVYDILGKALAYLDPVFYTGEESTAEKLKSVKAFTEGNSKVFIASLRSGAGLDGLQNVSRIVLFAELDWSPAQHEQCIGRVSRDGQPYPVIVYYLISESGSDPVIADTLGIKRVQAESIREGRDASTIIQQRDVGGAKKLARSFLRSKGYTIEQIAEIEGVSPAEIAEERVPLGQAKFTAKAVPHDPAFPFFAAEPV